MLERETRKWHNWGLEGDGDNRNSVGRWWGSVFLGKFAINGTEHSDTQKHSCFRSACFRDDLLKFCAWITWILIKVNVDYWSSMRGPKSPYLSRLQGGVSYKLCRKAQEITISYFRGVALWQVITCDWGTNSLDQRSASHWWWRIIILRCPHPPCQSCGICIENLALGMTRSWVCHSGSLHARSSEAAALLSRIPFPCCLGLTSVYWHVQSSTFSLAVHPYLYMYVRVFTPAYHYSCHRFSSTFWPIGGFLYYEP